MRTFIAIDIPEEVEKEILKIQKNLPKFIGKKTEPENLHLTLKFLGEIDEEKVEEIKKKLQEIKFESFESEISEVGVFSEKFIKIIWIKLGGQGISNLQKQIDDVLDDLFDREKRFMSHLTIARVKNVNNKNEFLKKLSEIKVPKIKFNINGFKLKKSTLTPKGPIYDVLEEYNFN